MEDEHILGTIARLMTREPGLAVEMRDEITHGIASDGTEASAGAARRQESIGRGDRTYHIREHGKETFRGLANADQVRRLIGAGAVWTGPEHNRPPGAPSSHAFGLARKALDRGGEAVSVHVEIRGADSHAQVTVAGIGAASIGGGDLPMSEGGPVTDQEAHALVRLGARDERGITT